MPRERLVYLCRNKSVLVRLIMTTSFYLNYYFAEVIGAEHDFSLNAWEEHFVSVIFLLSM